jgi:hypothetical protein
MVATPRVSGDRAGRDIALVSAYRTKAGRGRTATCDLPGRTAHSLQAEIGRICRSAVCRLPIDLGLENLSALRVVRPGLDRGFCQLACNRNRTLTKQSQSPPANSRSRRCSSPSEFRRFFFVDVDARHFARHIERHRVATHGIADRPLSEYPTAPSSASRPTPCRSANRCRSPRPITRN